MCCWAGLVVSGLGGHDAGDEGLGVAVVEGEPGALNLDHDAMSFEEDVVGGVEGELVFLGGVGGDGFGLGEAGAVAAAEDFVDDHELVAGGGGVGAWVDAEAVGAACGVGRGGLCGFVGGGVVGEDVDELDDPVAVGAGGGGDQVGLDVAGDGEVVVEGRSGEGGDVFAAVGQAGIVRALILDKPGVPVGAGVVSAFDGSAAVGDGVGGVGCVRLEGVGVGGLLESEGAVGVQIEIMVGYIFGRPLRVVHPAVGAGLIGGGVGER